jgi:hypothetical protein
VEVFHEKESAFMTVGWDVSELLAQIEERDQQIARLVPSSLTELEVKLTYDAVCQTYTPDKLREMATTPASVIRKLRLALDGFEAARRADAELVASLTEEERRLILSMRAGKPTR